MSALDWSLPELRWGLVHLLETGRIRRNRSNEDLVDWLREVGWLSQGPRRDLFLLNPARSEAVEDRLEALWPSWHQELAALDREGLTRDETGLRRMRRRALPLSALPDRLHRKTWMARFGSHSKAGNADAAPPPTLTLTDDDLLRLRPNRGLVLHFADGTERGCEHWTRAFGELAIPQRALSSGLSPGGEPARWVMTVENLGAYMDLPAPPDALIVHQPGWNCRLAQRLIALLPASLPWWHFGDLDPKGLSIFEALGKAARRPRLFLPDWWSDYLATHGLRIKGGWPKAASHQQSALLAELRDGGLWLEQEAILLDPRLKETLEHLSASNPAP